MKMIYNTFFNKNLNDIKHIQVKYSKNVLDISVCLNNFDGSKPKLILKCQITKGNHSPGGFNDEEILKNPF